MRRPTIYEIKKLTMDSSPYYFSKATMSFFGQRLKDFRVHALDKGRYKITCDSLKTGYTSVRYFNPDTNTLDRGDEND